jgi:hypothetical protein
LGQFARTGSKDDMRRGVGHYVHKGLGGTGFATRRFGGTARTAGTLYNALSSAAAGQPPTLGSPLDPALLAGRSADQVMDAVVEAVRPTDGTQDGEASRSAIRDALSDVLTQFPDANLLDLSQDQRLFAIERYLALDVFRRFCLDVGKAIQDKAVSPSAALSRFREVRDYLKETVAAEFRKLQAAAQTPTAIRVAQMAAAALREAFNVFQEYV